MYNRTINERKTMEDMVEDFGWDMNDFWEGEILTPEEQEASDRAQARITHEEMLGEMYNARYCFD
jgi:hypothetical protein